MSPARERYVVGVDLGGTRLRVALANRHGTIVRHNTVPTVAEEGRNALIRRIVVQVRAVLEPLPLPNLAAVAIAVPGPVDPRTGTVFHPPNLPGWGEVPLRTILAEDLGVPVSVINDGTVAALAEHQFGAGRGMTHLIYLTVSTGIGAGVIDDNRLIHGAWGGAGEVGHMTIDLNGPRCSCGNFGCLEAMASGTAIAQEACRRLAAGHQSVLRQDLCSSSCGIRAETVVRAAADGDCLARNVLDWAGYNLGVGLANILHLFDPQLVIVGGGVSNAWPLLQLPVNRALRERAMEAYVNRARIVRAQLGDQAGLRGTVALALRSADDT